MNWKKSTLAYAIACASLAMSTAAKAQEKPSENRLLEEVVVTSARGRDEDVQNIPVAVTALTQELLSEAKITNTSELGRLAPNLQIAKSVSTADVATVYLRGFGTYGADLATEPKVAMFIDGIYQPAAVGTLLDTFDADRIEAQAGPQGTLLGKNAPVGAIYVASERPTGDLGGTLQLDYGSYDRFGARGKVHFPIVKDESGDSLLAGRVSFVRKDGGDWVKNTFTGKRDLGGEDTKGARVSLLFTPNEDFTWFLSGLYNKSEAPQTGARGGGGFPAVLGDKNTVAQPASAECFFVSCAPRKYGTTASAFTAGTEGEMKQLVSTMDYSLEPVTLTFVAGRVKYERFDNQDVAGVEVPILNVYGDHHDFEQTSGEFRVRSNDGGGWNLDNKLDWVVGVFYSDFTYDSENHIGLPGTSLGQISIVQQQHGETASKAGFFQSTYHFTTELSGTVGARRSFDEKDHSYVAPTTTAWFDEDSAKWSDTSWEASIAYQFDPDLMTYFRFAQGYAAGGFVGFPGCVGCGAVFDPETNDSYEVGLKSDWFDHAVRFNLSLFLNKLSDLQVAGTTPTTTPPFFLQTTTNAASATVEGVESQIIIAPTADFSARLTVGYLNPKYDDYMGTVCSNTVGAQSDCSGVPFAFAPRWTVSAGATYRIDLSDDIGELELGANWNFKSSLYTADAPVPSSYQGGFGLLDLNIKYTTPSGLLSAELYATNVTDKEYTAMSTGVPGLLVAYNDGRPSEFGIRLTQKFGD